MNESIRSIARKILNSILAPLGLSIISKRHFTDDATSVYQSLPETIDTIFIEDGHKFTVKSVMPYIHKTIMHKTYWFGVQTLKNPYDVWVYQQLIFDIRPDVVIEIGTRFGGSAYVLAHMFDLLGHGRIISVDIDLSDVDKRAASHPRITMLEGDACEMESVVRSMIKDTERVLVIEDSSHTYENTINVLRKYSTYVTPGSYFIVEDSVTRHGLEGGLSRGPYEAIETFIKENDSFSIDREQERFYITFNPKGFLKRIS